MSTKDTTNTSNISDLISQHDFLFANSYEDIVESLPIGTLVFRIADGHTQIITINERLLQFANMVHAYVATKDNEPWDKERLLSVFAQNIYAFAVDEDIHIVEDLVAEAGETGYSQKYFRLRGTSGENTMWINSMCSSKELADHSHIYYTLFLDSTRQIVYENQLLDKQKELEYISQYDSLTGVCNRYSYNLYLEQNKNSLKHQTGFVFADLNGLKSANDEFGHLFGDSLIVGFAEMLLKYFDRHSIFRISGDEFVVIQEKINIIDFENNVNAFIAEVNKQDTAAVGYKWETTVVDLKQAIYQTEQLMMIQKQRYYINHSNQESKHRPKILKDLVADIDNNRFLVYLQPKATMGSSKVIGAEALIRKIGEDGQVISPFEFVPILEKELLISRIDFFVLEEVCKLLSRWHLEGRRIIKISVNMSRVSIVETDFIQHILSICDKYQVDHQYLEFEITESIETKDNRKFPETLTTLHELGFGVALDDMGNGYSSLRMLTMQSVDMVKIDRSLVLQIHDIEGAALIRYVIALCHEIGKKCIAEGVENVSQAAILTDMKCDYFQGYLLDRPIPVEELEAYLQ